MTVTRLWCDPKFKRKIKVAAAQKGISISRLTKDIASDEEGFDDFIRISRKNEKRFFRF